MVTIPLLDRVLRSITFLPLAETRRLGPPRRRDTSEGALRGTIGLAWVRVKWLGENFSAVSFGQACSRVSVYLDEQGPGIAWIAGEVGRQSRTRADFEAAPAGRLGHCRLQPAP